jgi:hypothetical protein
MRLILTALLFSALASASPTICPPDFTTDGVRVTADCPGLGVDVFADPGSTWVLAWNDNAGVIDNDYDFNDLIASISVADNGLSALVTWTGALAENDNELFDGSEFLFSNSYHPASVDIATVPDEEIPFDLISPGSGHWVTGAASLNSDDQIHDWTGEKSGLSQVPEPDALSFGLVGLGLISLRAVRRGR